MKITAKKIINFLREAIIYVLIVVGLIYVIPKTLSYGLKTSHPLASITSSSMWPALKKGDLVIIKGIEDKKSIKLNDVVVYQNEKGFTIHRVVKLNESTLVTKGDANNVNDKPIAYNQIVGRIVNLGEKPLKIPLLGMVSIFAQGHK